MTTETTNDTSATSGIPKDHEIEALFVQTADGMAYADGVLTLIGMAPTPCSLRPAGPCDRAPDVSGLLRLLGRGRR